MGPSTSYYGLILLECSMIGAGEDQPTLGSFSLLLVSLFLSLPPSLSPIVPSLIDFDCSQSTLFALSLKLPLSSLFLILATEDDIQMLYRNIWQKSLLFATQYSIPP